MGLENHRRAKEFVENVARRLTLASSQSDERNARVALLQYGSQAEQKVEFSLTHNLTIISDSLAAMTYMDSSSSLGSAIIHAVNNLVMLQGGSRLARRNAELSFVFITDGVTSAESLEEGVTAMRRAEGVPTVVAMGTDTDAEVLRKVALGDPAAIFHGTDYTALSKPAFFERFCSPCGQNGGRPDNGAVHTRHGGGCRRGEEKCSEDDRSLSGSGSAAETAYEDP
ncbi:hypothetical protein NHX12_004915 [Muraenolepis orangiensis]|uniref:VWFA domain-containing protein n=1 Tax=Muraenolepis orangiensis TaxID=630683 RepID=A0A9Q0DW33_9TELE|nr:hypothetical protein NHX12_004915 [Muraenolepis orangiensis]